jgi:hypothetical protein
MLMRNLPSELTPMKSIKIDLPSGRSIDLPCCNPCFIPWAGEKKSVFTWGGKFLLDWQGTPVFAELLILRILQSQSWQGVWVECYPTLNFLGEMPIDWALTGAKISVPSERSALINQISQRAGRSGGCFDVFAWREDQMLFCEAKRQKKDALLPTQRRWIEAALDEGIARDQFLIVEWSI